MNKKDLTKKSDADLYKLLREKREEVQSIRFGTTGSKARDVNVLKKRKREVARILTELNERAHA